MAIGEGAEHVSSLRLGDVHVGMADRNGQLEVEVIQARGLIPKMGSKSIPGRWPVGGSGSGMERGGRWRRVLCWDHHRTLLRITVSHPFSNAATYVKVYLLENGVCLAKKKTKVVKKTCDPSYQQPLLFEESPQGKVLQVMYSPPPPPPDTWGQGGIRGARTGHRNPASSLLSFRPQPPYPNCGRSFLAGHAEFAEFSPKLPAGERGSSPDTSSAPQVIVWGDYGRMDHKCFMGMAQIILEELDLSSAVAGWYKLFPTSSLADSSIGPLTRRLSQSSLESSTSPSCP